MKHKTIIDEETIVDLLKAEIESPLNVSVLSVEFDEVKGIIVEWEISR